MYLINALFRQTFQKLVADGLVSLTEPHLFGWLVILAALIKDAFIFSGRNYKSAVLVNTCTS